MSRILIDSMPTCVAKPRLVAALVALGAVSLAHSQTIGNCPVFPANSIWNARVDTLPVHSKSSTYINTIGPMSPGHADFGAGLYAGGPIGIPFTTVAGTQAKVAIAFDAQAADESDPGPYPIPAGAPIEGGSQSGGDRHVLVIDRDNCVLYELFYAFPQTDGSWSAGSGAIFDLRSNQLRPATWTSADAAGLPIFAGLARYDEVASGEIRHALRFTVPNTQKWFVWPGRHYASSITDTSYPPMGQRFRLKASFDISGFSPDTQVILRALQKYGMILADNGSAWFVSGAPDDRWNNDHLSEFRRLIGLDFEAVDESSLMANANSGVVKPSSSKIGILRSGMWVIDQNGNFQWDGTPTDQAFNLGQQGDLPVVGDWNGDGHAKAGIFRNGLWMLDYNGNGVWDGMNVDRTFNLGQQGDIPVVGDWNGDGRAKAGIFRNGLWVLDYNGNGAWDGLNVDRAFNLGQAGDIPVVGDWNGDGRAKAGIFRNGLWVLDYNGNGAWDGLAIDRAFNLGQAGDTPLVGDWNGDGHAKVAIFRNGLWVFDYNGNGQWDGPQIDRSMSLGQAGDIPVVGDWNGSGTVKGGIFRNGLWVFDYNGNFVYDGTVTDRISSLGTTGDKPVPARW